MMRKLLFAGSLALATVLTGCGGSSGSGSGGNGGGGGGGGSSVSVSIAPTSATVALNGTQQFSALVSPSSAAQTVTWSVSAGANTTCSTTTACGTVDANGLYTAPSALPTGNQVKVTATSTQDTTKSSTATVTLVSTQNSRFSGTYTFRFNGFNTAGGVLVVGNMVTDGNGNITGGSEVISTSTGPTASRNITSGSYSVGTDGRGDMVLNTSSGDKFCYVFAVGSTTLDNPLFIQFNNVTAPIACTGAGMGSGTHGSGVMNLASRSAFGPSALNQPYVFELNGFDASGKRASYVGRFVADGAGTISSWMLDRNDNGAASGLLSGTGTYTINNNTGAGIITLTGGPTLNVYIKDTDELALSVADPIATNPSAEGVAESQDMTPTYDLTTFKGISVFYATGVGTNPNTGWVVAGLATTNGAGSVTGTFDQNNGGSIMMNASLGNGTYSPTGSGRYTISLNGVPYVMYGITTNKAFLLDQASPQVLSGLVEPQTANPTANTIGGTFVETSHQVSTAADQNIVGALTLNNSTGGVSGTQDSTDGTEIANQSVTGTYTVSSNGRGNFNFTAPATSTGIVYVINQSKFIAIPLDATNTAPQVLVDVR